MEFMGDMVILIMVMAAGTMEVDIIDHQIDQTDLTDQNLNIL
jgi:hypothetical protein